MKRILLLSDTHGYVDDAMLAEARMHDEIWHAGDWGNDEVYEKLAVCGPIRAVYGNIDGGGLRMIFPQHLHFTCEDLKVYMTHIAGYPKRYKKQALKEIKEHAPDIVVCGHSHILKVMFDEKYQHLHINPGAIGKSGFHKVRTMISFKIDQRKPTDMKVFEYRK